MRIRVEPEIALNFTKISVILACSWPPSKFADKIHRFSFNLRWSIAFILLLLLFLPLLTGVYTYRNDTLILVKAVCLSSATAQALIKMAICRIQWSRLHMLHSELETFIKDANPLERKYIQTYVDRGAAFHFSITMSMWLVCLAFIIEPIILSQSFPTDVAYPFSINHKLGHAALYLQQILALFVIASALTVDFQVATLLWFAGARFEILGHDFEKVSNEKQLTDCVKTHQHILWYADEVNHAVRFIALGTIATTTIGVICGCLTLISHQPISVKLRIGNIVINAAVELFIYSWPADNLFRMSQVIGWKVYNCQWVGGSPMMRKTVLTVICRSQKPAIICINGFIPNLSLQYYTAFLSTTFSYFTKLRVMFLASGFTET